MLEQVLQENDGYIDRNQYGQDGRKRSQDFKITLERMKKY